MNIACPKIAPFYVLVHDVYILVGLHDVAAMHLHVENHA